MAATLIITIFLPCKSELRVLLCEFCSTILFYGFIFYIPPLLSVTGSPVTGRPGSVSVTDLSGARLVIHLTARVYERDPTFFPEDFVTGSAMNLPQSVTGHGCLYVFHPAVNVKWLLQAAVTFEI